MAYVRTTLRATAPKVDVETLFDAQHGLASRRQILAAGFSDEDIRLEIRARRWQRVLPGLYANTTGAINLEQRRFAAVLFTSPRAQLTGVGALAWHGLRYLPPDPLVHVLVPHQVRRGSRGFVRVQRTHRLDPDPHIANGYAVCSVARAAADACRGLGQLREVRAIVAEVIQNGHASVPELERELEFAGSSRTALLRRAVREVASGARSAPEAELQEILPSGGTIPMIIWNPQLESLDGTRLPSPDGWIEELGIALEVDSREYHLNPEGWQQTMRRHNLLSAYGALVLHFTPSEIRYRQRLVRGTVERSCEQRVASGAIAAIRVISTPGLQAGAPDPG